MPCRAPGTALSVSAADARASGTLDHLTATYRFARGPAHVSAEAGWDHAGGFPFFMGYVVAFEEATAVYASDRDPPLVLHRDGTAQPLPLELGTGYDGEIRHFLDACAGSAPPEVTLADALAVTRILERLNADLK